MSAAEVFVNDMATWVERTVGGDAEVELVHTMECVVLELVFLQGARSLCCP